MVASAFVYEQADYLLLGLKFSIFKSNIRPKTSFFDIKIDIGYKIELYLASH